VAKILLENNGVKKLLDLKAAMESHARVAENIWLILTVLSKTRIYFFFWFFE
jgi:hypothetical protein